MQVNSSNVLQYSYNMIYQQYTLSMLRTERNTHSGGCGRVVIDQQEWAVVERLRASNDIRLPETKQAIEGNNDTFANVASINFQ